MKNAIIRISISLLMALLFFAGSGNFQNAAAQEQERGISLHAVYTHVVVPLEESDVQFTVTLANNGKTGEGIQLQVTSAPDGWNYQFRSIYPENTIRAIYLTPAEEDPDKASQDVRFIVALPPNEVCFYR
jgi:hypothetical protein